MSVRVNLSARLGRARMYWRRAVWAFPALAIFIGLLLAGNITRLDWTVTASLGGLLTTGGPEGARDLVQTVASTSVTVATFVFSVTIVALQVAASQYSPRVPRQFIRDRLTQVTLAIFILTFVYSLAVVRMIHASEDFVPQIAVTIAFLLSLMSVGAFVYFVHHIIHAMRVETILNDLERKTVAAIHDNYELLTDSDPRPELPEIPTRAKPLHARGSDIIQRIDADLLVTFAQKHDLVIHFVRELGEQAVADTAIAWVWTRDPDAELPDPEKVVRPKVLKALQLGRERSLQADVGFGLTQLVDIALRAVSSAINDPTTACASIRACEVVLVQLCKHWLGDQLHHDDAGELRIAVPRRSFPDYLETVVTPLRHTCPHDLTVMLRLCEMLANVGRAAANSEDQRRHVAEQLMLVIRASGRAIDERNDLRKLDKAARAVKIALSGEPPRLA